MLDSTLRIFHMSMIPMVIGEKLWKRKTVMTPINTDLLISPINVYFLKRWFEIYCFFHFLAIKSSTVSPGTMIFSALVTSFP